MADAIRKIRDRSNRERSEILRRRMKEAEKANDLELLSSLTVEWQKLRLNKEGAA
jgi:hypothetical protein